MAYGPLGRGWPQRARYAGTYDQAWLDDHFPFLPPDFDDRYHQAAPPDQQMPHPAQALPVRLTNLTRPFWPELGITKSDLLQYYADVSPGLLPHLRDRAMVMKRYPHGAAGEFFFMKRTPSPHPSWLERCSIAHRSCVVATSFLAEIRGGRLDR